MRDRVVLAGKVRRREELIDQASTAY